MPEAVPANEFLALILDGNGLLFLLNIPEYYYVFLWAGHDCITALKIKRSYAEDDEDDDGDIKTITKVRRSTQLTIYFIKNMYTLNLIATNLGISISIGDGLP